MIALLALDLLAGVGCAGVGVVWLGVGVFGDIVDAHVTLSPILVNNFLNIMSLRRLTCFGQFEAHNVFRLPFIPHHLHLFIEFLYGYSRVAILGHFADLLVDFEL